jgi:hypothetical protein
MGDGACLWSDELKISQPEQHTALRPKKKKTLLAIIENTTNNTHYIFSTTSFTVDAVAPRTLGLITG